MFVNQIFLWISTFVTIFSNTSMLKYEEENADTCAKVVEQTMHVKEKTTLPMDEHVYEPEPSPQEEYNTSIGKQDMSPREQVVAKLFARYDIDGNGTINTHEVLSQLSVNCIMTLNMRYTTAHIETAVNALGELNGDRATIPAMSFKEYSQWFHNSFEVENDEPVVATKGKMTNLLALPSNADSARGARTVPHHNQPSRDWQSWLVCILFPAGGTNYADKCAKVWLILPYFIFVSIFIWLL